jgi:3-oxoacyl-[acyl-carrier protein] reductase
VIAFIGANSWLVERLVPILLEQEPICVVGSSLPGYVENIAASSRNSLSFVETDYSSSENIVHHLETHDLLTVVFAGVGTVPSLIANTDQAEVSATAASHIVFPFSLVSKLLPSMIRAKYGRFIFIGSTEGSKGIVGASLYTIVKAAQRGLSRSIAVEYGRFGVTANVIDLGYLSGGQTRHVSKEKQEFLVDEGTPRGKVQVPDVASTVSYLVSNSSVNGTVVSVDSAG